MSQGLIFNLHFWVELVERGQRWHCLSRISHWAAPRNVLEISFVWRRHFIFLLPSDYRCCHLYLQVTKLQMLHPSLVSLWEPWGRSFQICPSELVADPAVTSSGSCAALVPLSTVVCLHFFQQAVARASMQKPVLQGMAQSCLLSRVSAAPHLSK